MKSATCARKLWPFQCTKEPPRPVPGKKLSHRRIGSAVWSELLRKVTASFALSCIIPLRIENRSSSWIAGDWKSGTVSRAAQLWEDAFADCENISHGRKHRPIRRYTPVGDLRRNLSCRINERLYGKSNSILTRRSISSKFRYWLRSTNYTPQPRILSLS
jgi:hypothetical protein